jgi:uncharacterized integral membrane protein
MSTVNIFFGSINILCGIVFVLVSLPLIKQKIPMNRYYGFRIAKSYASDENWYAINRYGGKQMIQWSILLILIGILYFIFPIKEHADENLNYILAIAPLPICVGIAIVKTVIYSKQL